MILVAATTASWLGRSNPDLTTRWLDTAEALAASHDVRFFATLEAHPERREPLDPLVRRLEGLGGDIWWFWLDDGEDQAQTNLRTRRVCTGRNLVIEYALHHRSTHVLFLDADLMPPGDAIPKLLDMDWPIVGGDVPNYALSGPVISHRRRWRSPWTWVETDTPYPYEVQEHWNTAGFLLVRTEVLQNVRWGWDPIGGYSDDPWFADRVVRAGYGQTLVRKDCIGDHAPLGVLESRPKMDRRLDR